MDSVYGQSAIFNAAACVRQAVRARRRPRRCLKDAAPFAPGDDPRGIQFSVPGRRVVHPSAADHRRHHFHGLELLWRTVERVTREHDEVGEESRNELASPPLVAREPGRVDGRGAKRIFDPERLLRMPRGPLVDRPQHSGPEPGGVSKQAAVDLPRTRNLGSVHWVADTRCASKRLHQGYLRGGVLEACSSQRAA